MSSPLLFAILLETRFAVEYSRNSIERKTSRQHPQPDTKANRNHNPNSNLTTKQHAVVNIQLNIATCARYPDKFI